MKEDWKIVSSNLAERKAFIHSYAKQTIRSAPIAIIIWYQCSLLANTPMSMGRLCSARNGSSANSQ